jgi:hypothetical protein
MFLFRRQSFLSSGKLIHFNGSPVWVHCRFLRHLNCIQELQEQLYKEKHMIAFLDPETVWLTLTNATLGLVTLVCVSVVVYAVVKEMLVRSAAKNRIPVEADTHVFRLEELGITMADGGERLDESKSPIDDPPNIIRSDN